MLQANALSVTTYAIIVLPVVIVTKFYKMSRQIGVSFKTTNNEIWHLV